MKIRVPENFLIKDSIVDGPGFRTVIFTQGCCHKCKGCHNPNTWSFKDGKDIDILEVQHKLEECDSIISKGLTISGGEPFLQARPLRELVRYYKNNIGKSVWIFSGFTFEEIKRNPEMFALLKEVDVLVDGKFIEEQKSLSLKFKGSQNQRIIDVQKSLDTFKVIQIG